MADDADIQRYRRRVASIPQKMQEAARPALLKSGDEAAAMMKRLAPEDDGDLIESIVVTGPGDQTPPYSQPGGAMTVPENAVAVTVGDQDVRYPHLQEYGTTFHPAQPFFWPSIRLLRKRIAGRIKRAVGKSVRDNWGKP